MLWQIQQPYFPDAQIGQDEIQPVHGISLGHDFHSNAFTRLRIRIDRFV
jgi:hypothetical protein